MIDSVKSSGGSSVALRSSALAQVSAMRGSGVLNAVQQAKASDSNAPSVKVFAVPQSSAQASSAPSAPSNVPRGSLVDVLV